MKTIADIIGITITVAELAETQWKRFQAAKDLQQIKVINQAWEEARKEENLDVDPIFNSVKKNEFRFNEPTLEKLKELGLSSSTSKYQENYVDNIESAISTIDAYKESRFTRTWNKGKDGDIIDITLATARGMLIHASTFDGGLNYQQQQITIKFIKCFLNKFGSQGKLRKAPCEKACGRLKMALEHLEQMNLNKSAHEKLSAISTACKETATTSLKLAAAAMQPTEEVLKCISRAEIKDIAFHDVYQAQCGTVVNRVGINKGNPFSTRIVMLAKVLSGITERQIIEETLAIPLLYSTDFTDQYLKEYSIFKIHPPILQLVKEATVSETAARLLNQDDAKIQNRFNQFDLLIKFSSQIHALYQLARLSSNYAQFFGDVAIYTEENNKKVITLMRNMLSAAQETFSKCQELIQHIDKMNETITLNLKEEIKKPYSSLAKIIKKNLPKVENHVNELVNSKSSSFIKEKADKAEEELKEFLDIFWPLYNPTLQKPDKPNKPVEPNINQVKPDQLPKDVNGISPRDEDRIKEIIKGLQKETVAEYKTAAYYYTISGGMIILTAIGMFRNREMISQQFIKINSAGMFELVKNVGLYLVAGGVGGWGLGSLYGYYFGNKAANKEDKLKEYRNTALTQIKFENLTKKCEELEKRVQELTKKPKELESERDQPQPGTDAPENPSHDDEIPLSQNLSSIHSSLKKRQEKNFSPPSQAPSNFNKH